MMDKKKCEKSESESLDNSQKTAPKKQKLSYGAEMKKRPNARLVQKSQTERPAASFNKASAGRLLPNLLMQSNADQKRIQSDEYSPRQISRRPAELDGSKEGSAHSAQLGNFNLSFFKSFYFYLRYFMFCIRKCLPCPRNLFASIFRINKF